MNRALYPLLGGIMALGLMSVAPGAHATVITYTFAPDAEFSNETGELSGSVVVTLDDHNSSGSVDVTIDTSGLDASIAPDEFISGLYLNVTDDTSLPLGVAFDGGTVDPADVSQSRDGHMADGDGFFDILITWDPNTLVADLMDTITFTLSDLVAESFFALSADGGGHGPFHAALKAQGLGADGEESGWFFPTVGFGPGDETLVPEPGTLALFGFGLAGLALAVCRRRKVT